MNSKILLGGSLLALCVGVSIATIGYGEEHMHESAEHNGYTRAAPMVPAVTNKQYLAECGSCHFAYQPQWLPARSWQKMMGELDNHFGENAELDADTQKALTDFLVANAADKQKSRVAQRVMRSVLANQAPQRISELHFIKRDHDEIPSRLIKGNPKVGSRSACQACHTQAAQGMFNEGGINIPGYGRWEDD